MATTDKEDIQLRQETNAPLATKGSAFTFKNMDDNFTNFIIMIQVIQVIQVE